jgi:hypothetical protein
MRGQPGQENHGRETMTVQHEDLEGDNCEKQPDRTKRLDRQDWTVGKG